MAQGMRNEEIQKILIQCKKLVAQHKLEFIPRDKNLQSLAKHGMQIEDAEDELMELNVNDYISGPQKERNPQIHKNGDIWIFKKKIDGIWFYIKLKISIENNHTRLKCLSFHEDER